MVVPARFLYASRLKEGIALAHSIDAENEAVLLDASGSEVLRLQNFEAKAYEFSHGLLPGKDLKHSDKLVGYIDRSGEFVIPPQFQSAYSFDQHGAIAKLPGERTMTRIDFSGKPCGCNFADILVFHPAGDYCGASVNWMRRGADVVIDGKGEIVSSRRFDNVNQEHEGLIPVEYRRGLVGWVNTAAEDVFQIEAAGIGTYFESGVVPLSMDGELWGLVNDRGEWVVEPEFHIATPAGPNRFMLGKFGGDRRPAVRLTDGSGNVIGDHEFVDVGEFIDGIASIDRQKASDPEETETNYVNLAGDLVLPFWW